MCIAENDDVTTPCTSVSDCLSVCVCLSVSVFPNHVEFKSSHFLAQLVFIHEKAVLSDELSSLIGRLTEVWAESERDGPFRETNVTLE